MCAVAQIAFHGWCPSSLFLSLSLSLPLFLIAIFCIFILHLKWINLSLRYWLTNQIILLHLWHMQRKIWILQISWIKSIFSSRPQMGSPPWHYGIFVDMGGVGLVVDCRVDFSWRNLRSSWHRLGRHCFCLEIELQFCRLLGWSRFGVTFNFSSTWSLACPLLCVVVWLDGWWKYRWRYFQRWF